MGNNSGWKTIQGKGSDVHGWDGRLVKQRPITLCGRRLGFNYTTRYDASGITCQKCQRLMQEAPDAR